MAIRATVRTILVVTGLAMVGCESPQVVDHFPSPNFNGPSIAQAPVAPRPMPRVTPAPVPAPPKAKPYAGNVPREWIPLAGAKREWLWIVIHHSATPAGSVKDFDREHRAKGWDECGYHFVIGNGSNSGNGQIEVSGRWPVQKQGAHAKTPDNQFNNHGIGICLVGNFQLERPTAAQMQSLNKLVAYLSRTYKIPTSKILRHKDTKSTECPGRNLNVEIVRRSVQQQLAGMDGLSDSGPTPVVFDGSGLDDSINPSNDGTVAEPITASAELLKDVAAGH